MKIPPRAVFKSDHLWTWLAVFFSLVVCALLSYLRVEQSKTMLEAASMIRNIGQARVDLNEGFLHLTLSGDAASPFRAGEGLALVDQAVATLREARERGTAGHPIKLDAAIPWDEFEKTAKAFRSQLDRWSHTPENARAGLALPLHFAFHQLEHYASQIDDLSQEKLEEISAHLSRTFLIATGVSMVLLCGICMGVYVAGRNQRAAVRAMRHSEERLRILGDNLPDGYIFQYQQREDGTCKFPYVSAGVEQVNGFKAADCMRDAGLLLGQMDPRQYAVYTKTLGQCARNLSNFAMDMHFRHPDGRNRVIRIHSHPVADKEGKITWYGMTLDVTEHREAEMKIRKNEQLLEEMGRTAKIGGWEYGVEADGGEWTEELAPHSRTGAGGEADAATGARFPKG